MRPEHFGADVLWLSRLGLVGVQRKEISDFLASVMDGRLSQQVAQMQGLDIRVLALEGRLHWTTDGTLVSTWGQTWTKRQHRSFLWSMRHAGVWVDWTDGLSDTIDLVKDLELWSKKRDHTSLQKRPAARGDWGKPSSREWMIHFLQSFDGIGPVQAGRIIDSFEGQVPLAWTVDQKELEMVPGIGKKKAENMIKRIGVIRDLGGIVDKEVVA